MATPKQPHEEDPRQPEQEQVEPNPDDLDQGWEPTAERAEPSPDDLDDFEEPGEREPKEKS